MSTYRGTINSYVSLRAVILGGEFPDIPDMNGEPGDPLRDPLEGRGAGGAVSEAGKAAVESIPRTLPGTDVAMSKPNIDAIAESAPKSISISIENIPTTAEGNMGQTIQSTVSREIAANPTDFHDSALSRALEDPIVKGDPAKLTPEVIEKSYQTEADSRTAETTKTYKKVFGDTVKDAVHNVTEGDVDFDTTRSYDGKGSVVDQMIDDPKGTEEKLTKDAAEIEKKNPDWKERVKQVAGYGAKGLLVLALIGAFLPGGANVLSKLAGMAGSVVGKLVQVAANILKAFLGPLLKAFWDFVKKLKGPLVAMGIIICILLVLWIYRQVKG
jgi:hypothetical protein